MEIMLILTMQVLVDPVRQMITSSDIMLVSQQPITHTHIGLIIKPHQP